jgi:penicillin-insensitive murein endopeptidase
VLSRGVRAVFGLAVFAVAGCMGFTPVPSETVSWGTTNDGVLYRGLELADRGAHYERARPGESTRYGTSSLITALERAMSEVERRYPGSAPVRVGDLSSPGGGRHPRHGSHRTGRDADVIFYMTDVSGRSVTGRGWLAYNRFGYAVEREESHPSGDLYFFDDARNWCFVRSLLLDEEAAVQWIFVSRGVKSRLLRWAAAHEEDARAIVRAAYVLHEPTGASPHDDHFHVRVMCSVRELAGGCYERGLVWPWLRSSREKPALPAGEPLDDTALLRDLLEPIE